MLLLISQPLVFSTLNAADFSSIYPFSSFIHIILIDRMSIQLQCLFIIVKLYSKLPCMLAENIRQTSALFNHCKNFEQKKKTKRQSLSMENMLNNQKTINTFMGRKCMFMHLSIERTMFNLIENYTRKMKIFQVTSSNRCFDQEN